MERITGDTKPGEEASDAAPVCASIGIDLRSSRVKEKVLGETGAADTGLFKRLLFGIKLTAGKAKTFQGFARGGVRIAGGPRGLGGKARLSPGKARMQRASQCGRRMPPRKIGGIEVNRSDFPDVGRSWRGGGAAEILDGLKEFLQGKAFARAGGTEKTDRERGFGTLVGGELGEKPERCVKSQRVGSAWKVGRKNHWRTQILAGFVAPVR